jgi:hypothetical protein
MSIWVSVYCRKRIPNLGPQKIVAEIKDRIAAFSDLYAQEDPEDTLSRLRVEEYARPDNLPLLHIHYLPAGAPIVIDPVTKPDEVAGYVQEYLEEHLQDQKGKQATLVRNHLGDVKEIFSFCLKQRHANGMGAPLTYAAAAWLADTGDGLVRADAQGWMQLTDYGEFFTILPE